VPERDRPELVEVTSAMIGAGVNALREEGFATPQEDLVNLIYMAMEYQRRRESASITKS
jgi:hypothetical protein